MPHYADGTEAKVGDQVTGKLYNTPGVRAGTIVSITPGSDSCNAKVAFIEAVNIAGDVETWEDVNKRGHWNSGRALGNGKAVSDVMPRMAKWEGGENPYPRFRIAQGENHGSAGAHFAIFECEDYCAVNELTKVS